MLLFGLHKSRPSFMAPVMSANGTKRTNSVTGVMSATDPKQTFFCVPADLFCRMPESETAQRYIVAKSIKAL